MVRILKLIMSVKKSDAQELSPKIQAPGISKIGERMSLLITQKVIIIVALMLVWQQVSDLISQDQIVDLSSDLESLEFMLRKSANITSPPVSLLLASVLSQRQDTVYLKIDSYEIINNLGDLRDPDELYEISSDRSSWKLSYRKDNSLQHVSDVLQVSTHLRR